MELKKASSSTKNITEKVLDILIDANSDIKVYNASIDDFNDLGGIDGIGETMGWDSQQKCNWERKIININALK